MYPSKPGKKGFGVKWQMQSGHILALMQIPTVVI